MDTKQALLLAHDLVVWVGPHVAGSALATTDEPTSDQTTALARRVWQQIQGWVADDEDAASDVRRLAKQPEKPSLQNLVAEALAEHAANSQAIASELTALHRELVALRGGTTPGRSHTQTISGNAQVGTAISGDVHGPVTNQSGGVNCGSGNTITNSGDVFGGDKVQGDKVMGNKNINYGAPRPADTSPDHIQRLLDLHTRRLRVLEQQAAITGLNVRPEVQIEIEDLRAEIARLEAVLGQCIT